MEREDRSLAGKSAAGIVESDKIVSLEMRMFCTFPRMRTLKILCAVLAAVMPGLPSSAQNARPNSRPAQSEMHIRVRVVPVVTPPRHHRHKDRDEEAVVYNLETHPETMSVTEEVRPMLVQSRQEQVRIITVVAK
jgi:hypothetical protein